MSIPTNEPNWLQGCAAEGLEPGKECADCLYQRRFFGYIIVDGNWVKS